MIFHWHWKQCPFVTSAIDIVIWSHKRRSREPISSWKLNSKYIYASERALMHLLAENFVIPMNPKKKRNDFTRSSKKGEKNFSSEMNKKKSIRLSDHRKGSPITAKTSQTTKQRDGQPHPKMLIVVVWGPRESHEDSISPLRWPTSNSPASHKWRTIRVDLFWPILRATCLFETELPWKRRRRSGVCLRVVRLYGLGYNLNWCEFPPRLGRKTRLVWSKTCDKMLIKWNCWQDLLFSVHRNYYHHKDHYVLLSRHLTSFYHAKQLSLILIKNEIARALPFDWMNRVVTISVGDVS